MKNSLDGVIRLKHTEEGIIKREDRPINVIQSEEQKEKRMKKNAQSLRDLWETSKHNNMLTSQKDR